MKICRKHFDVLIKPTIRCSECAFKRKTRPCFWIKLFSRYTLDCGVIRATSLSDIFKL